LSVSGEFSFLLGQRWEFFIFNPFFLIRSRAVKRSFFPDGLCSYPRTALPDSAGVGARQIPGIHPGARIIRTGTQAERRIRSATLPQTHRLTPERPWVAMTIRSTLLRVA
jgi:hypothetical protein